MLMIAALPAFGLFCWVVQNYQRKPKSKSSDWEWQRRSFRGMDN
jgi:hypothetical protein